LTHVRIEVQERFIPSGGNVMDDEPLAIWMKKFQDDEPESAQRLWEAYYKKLVLLVRRRLGQSSRLVSDEEDVALSAFHSFWRGLKAGRYPRLDDHDDLWRILMTITIHKIVKLVRNETRQKRGGRWKRLESTCEINENLLHELAGREPTPQIAAQVAEEYERLLTQLASPELVQLATLKMEGYTNSEIAEQWKKAERTVERKLRLIRRLWQTELANSGVHKDSSDSHR
jgi:DNA-directed RNA polymerase specialized sigma24 family protein